MILLQYNSQKLSGLPVAYTYQPYNHQALVLTNTTNFVAIELVHNHQM